MKYAVIPSLYSIKDNITTALTSILVIIVIIKITSDNARKINDEGSYNNKVYPMILINSNRDLIRNSSMLRYCM